MDWDTILTRGLVLALYLGVFVHAFGVDTQMKGNWSRRASLHIIMLISGFWSAVYVWILIATWGVTLGGPMVAITMGTRIGHYVTAAGLWVIVSFLKMVNEKYDIVPKEIDKV